MSVDLVDPTTGQVLSQQQFDAYWGSQTLITVPPTTTPDVDQPWNRLDRQTGLSGVLTVPATIRPTPGSTDPVIPGGLCGIDVGLTGAYWFT